MLPDPENHSAFHKLVSELKCPICKDLLHEPFVTNCGHTFCHACIKLHIQSRQSKQCPCCGKYFVEDQSRPVFALQKVLSAASELLGPRTNCSANKLATFLSDTPVIKTSQEADSLIEVLKNRRSEIEYSQKSRKLQLLLLCLDSVKQKKADELERANKRMELIQRDICQLDNLALGSHLHAQSPSIPTAKLQKTCITSAHDAEDINTEGRYSGSKNSTGLDLKTQLFRESKIKEHYKDLKDFYYRARLPQDSSPFPRESSEFRCGESRTSNITGSYLADWQANSQSCRKEVEIDVHPARVFPACKKTNFDGVGDSSLDDLDNALKGATQYSQLISVAEMLPMRPGKRSAVTSIAFTNDSRVFATGGFGSSIQLHNFDSVVAAGTRVHKPATELRPPMKISALAFFPVQPAHLLSSGDASGAIRMWDINHKKPSSSPRVIEGHTDTVRSLSLTPLRPCVFASGSQDGSMRIWDVKCPGKPVTTADMGSTVCGVAFSPWDENILACATSSHSIYVYDIRNCQKPLSQVQKLEKPVSYVRFLSQRELVASSVNSTITLWSWERMKRVRTYKGHVNETNFAGMEACGDFIACGSETSQVHVYCKHLSKPIVSHTITPCQVPPSSSYFTLATAWKPQCTHLVAALSTGSCHILSLESEVI